MAETLTIRTASSTEVIKIAVQGPQGPAGAAGTGLETLTTKGDTLYRGETTGERLPIGTTGQILRVSASGVPEWGAAPASGVSSVNGETGAVTLTPADLDAAEANHTHNSADVFFQGLEILGAGNANTNGVYVYGGDLNGKGVFYKDKNTFVYWDGAAWMVSYNSDDIYSSAQNATTPWQVTSWSVESGQTSPAPSSWDRLTGDQWEAVVGQRINPTLRGDAAGKNVGTGANDVAAGNDSRFSDARQPLSHSSTHHTGGTDALAAHQINGQTIFTTAAATYSTDQTLSVQRARQITISNTNASGITVTLPTGNDGTLAGDTYVIIGGSTMAGPVTVRGVANLSPLVHSTLATITAAGQQYRFRSNGGSSGSWGLVPVDTHTHAASDITSGTLDIARIPTGTSSTTVCIGNDSRLSDSRTPTAHAASHASAGSDPLFDQNLNQADSVIFDSLRVSSAASPTVAKQVLVADDEGTIVGITGNEVDARASLGLGDAATANIGTGSTEVAAGDHVHGNLSSDGKIGSTAGLPVVTTTAGAVSTLALGAAGTVLTVNSGANGVEFASASGGGSSIMQSIAVGFVLN